MFVWHVVKARDGRVVVVDGWESLDAVIGEMATSSWEHGPRHNSASWVVWRDGDRPDILDSVATIS